jgi:hypothetical protein
LDIPEREMTQAGAGDTCTLPYDGGNPPGVGDILTLSLASSSGEAIRVSQWEVISVSQGGEQGGAATVMLKRL